MSYTLTHLELKLAERRLALQMAALDVREQRDDLSVKAERPAEGAATKEQRRQSWWRYY